MKKLIFVYNADSSLFAQARDYVHKIVSPESYACNLCRITWGVTMDKEWKRFVERLPYEVVFLHRDELRGEYSKLRGKSLPAVFILENGKFRQLLTTKEINKAKKVEDLKRLVSRKLNE